MKDGLLQDGAFSRNPSIPHPPRQALMEATREKVVPGGRDDPAIWIEAWARGWAAGTIVTISIGLGHADPAITLKTHTHLFEEDDAAADVINEAFGANSVPKTG